MAALDIFATDLCEPSMFCVNSVGNYSCECLAGTLLVEGVCEAGKFFAVDCMMYIKTFECQYVDSN